jgi:deoxyribonuclease (pyrimidine dimer)
MVRVNIINPKHLADQHLIAEYNEIMMLVDYVRKHPKTNLDKIPKEYTLGKGHMLFFKDKLRYLEERHLTIISEMKKRNFNVNKKLNLSGINEKLKKTWKPSKKDKEIIKERLIWKVNKKPNFYRYKSEKKPKEFFLNMINKAY